MSVLITEFFFEDKYISTSLLRVPLKIFGAISFKLLDTKEPEEEKPRPRQNHRIRGSSYRLTECH